MKRVRTVTPVTSKDARSRPRSTIVGVALNGKARAYPFPRLRAQSPVLDVLGGVPIVLVIGDDQKSIRVFERTLDGRTLELMAKAGAEPLRLLDAETGSEWDFSGRAVSGPLAGRAAHQGEGAEGILVRLEDLPARDHGLRAGGVTPALRRPGRYPGSRASGSFGRRILAGTRPATPSGVAARPARPTR